MSKSYDKLTLAQRWALADELAKERLPGLNATLVDVVPSRTLYARYIKRVLDVLISGCALIVILPINLILGILTFVDVGSPVFFRQKRVGRNGEEFTILKFRNMRDTRDANGELLPASQRVTRFGRAMRKTSLDELWNFWSIFKGDMSILGPRPLVPEYTHRYNKRHAMRLAVRPGLECPPKHVGDHVSTWQERLDNDVWYVEHLSFKTDCRMIVNLLRLAFDPKSTDARAASSNGIFMGYNEKGVAITLDGVPDELIERFSGVDAACMSDGTAKVVTKR